MPSPKSIIAAVTGIVFLLTASCTKYEEGPAFSLRTAGARLAGTWDAREYVYANGNTESDNSSALLTFEKDGTLKFVNGGTTYTGKWKFGKTDGKRDRTLLEYSYSYNNMGYSQTVTILRLTNKELWTKDGNGKLTKSVAD